MPAETVHADRALVCTVDGLATHAALEVLDEGGTAADAAIAANAVLAVTSPHLCGLGGDLFALVHRGAGAPEVLCASGAAGSGADPHRLRAEGHHRMPFVGDVRSVPVPGCVDGWSALHERHGRLPLRRLLVPAIALAEGGFPASPLLALATILLDGVEGVGELAPPVEPGQVLRRPGVGRVLRAVAHGGRDAFYLGEAGEALLVLGAGEFHEADLATAHARWEEPLVARVHDHDVWTTPAPTQGYLTPLSLLVAEGLDLPADPADGAWAHLLVEAARAAGWDRPRLLHEHAHLAPLLTPAEATARRAAIRPDRRAPRPAPAAPGDTTYLCVVDGEGTGVSLIESNASGFGAHLALGDTEVLVHNRGLGFSLEPDHPAEYGPGRRPPHTLAPALLTRPDGSLAACVGTMGGDQQPQILLQVLSRLLRHGEQPGTAIAAPRWALQVPGGTGFDTWSDDGAQRVVLEDGAPPDWDRALGAAGHRVGHESGTRFGHAHAIVVGPDGLSGAADPRAEGSLAAGA